LYIYIDVSEEFFRAVEEEWTLLDSVPSWTTLKMEASNFQNIGTHISTYMASCPRSLHQHCYENFVSYTSISMG